MRRQSLRPQLSQTCRRPSRQPELKLQFLSTVAGLPVLSGHTRLVAPVLGDVGVACIRAVITGLGELWPLPH